MKILVLNGSPRSHGNTSAMVSAFAEGAKEIAQGGLPANLNEDAARALKEAVRDIVSRISDSEVYEGNSRDDGERMVNCRGSRGIAGDQSHA